MRNVLIVLMLALFFWACFDAVDVTGTLEVNCPQPLVVVTDTLAIGTYNSLCPFYYDSAGVRILRLPLNFDLEQWIAEGNVFFTTR